MSSAAELGTNTLEAPPLPDGLVLRPLDVGDFRKGTTAGEHMKGCEVGIVNKGMGLWWESSAATGVLWFLER